MDVKIRLDGCGDGYECPFCGNRAEYAPWQDPDNFVVREYECTECHTTFCIDRS